MSLRSLPSVDAVLGTPEAAALLEHLPRPILTDAVRAVLDRHRQRLRADESADVSTPSAGEVATAAGQWTRTRLDPNLPRVINATGVVLHTNLGRAPLAPRALASLIEAARETSALELDLETGGRGRRDAHVEGLLAQLSGAEAAVVVNNNAAALLLVIDSLATRREVVVSRGELIEIGGAFRLPDVLRRAGAVLREVGTTNRTRIEDYARVLSRRTALLLRAHPSNFRIEGFTEEASRTELVQLARAQGIPFVEDLGSGALVDLSAYGAPREPTPADAIREGADLVTFSGDKLLGGPQSGLIVGRADLVEDLQRNPLKRALRVDKLTLAALRATLSLYCTSTDLAADLPAIGLLARTEETLEDLAVRASRLLGDQLPTDFTVDVVRSESQIGSGAQPTITLPSRAVRVVHGRWDAERVAAYFRGASPAILGRITRGAFLLDLRAVPRVEDLLPHNDEANPS